jgi:hypothetical protein
MPYLNPLIIALIVGAVAMLVSDVTWAGKRYSR